MTREQAEREQAQMAEKHPESTWLVAEANPGEWSVVRVGLKPSDSARTESTEERPIPSYADDPRHVTERDRGSNWVGPG